MDFPLASRPESHIFFNNTYCFSHVGRMKLRVNSTRSGQGGCGFTAIRSAISLLGPHGRWSEEWTSRGGAVLSHRPGFGIPGPTSQYGSPMGSPVSGPITSLTLRLVVWEMAMSPGPTPGFRGGEMRWWCGHSLCRGPRRLPHTSEQQSPWEGLNHGRAQRSLRKLVRGRVWRWSGT